MITKEIISINKTQRVWVADRLTPPGTYDKTVMLYNPKTGADLFRLDWQGIPMATHSPIATTLYLEHRPSRFSADSLAAREEVGETKPLLYHWIRLHQIQDRIYPDYTPPQPNLEPSNEEFMESDLIKCCDQALLKKSGYQGFVIQNLEKALIRIIPLKNIILSLFHPKRNLLTIFYTDPESTTPQVISVNPTDVFSIGRRYLKNEDLYR